MYVKCYEFKSRRRFSLPVLLLMFSHEYNNYLVQRLKVKTIDENLITLIKKC